jgi:hypothetical protein
MTTEYVAKGLFLIVLCLVLLISVFLLAPPWDLPNSSDSESELEQLVAEADKQWDNNQKSAAVEGYMFIVGSDLIKTKKQLSKIDIEKMYRRIIDFQIEKAGLDAGRPYIRKALRQGYTLSLSTPEANKVLMEEMGMQPKTAWNDDAARENFLINK